MQLPDNPAVQCQCHIRIPVSTGECGDGSLVKFLQRSFFDLAEMSDLQCSLERIESACELYYADNPAVSVTDRNNAHEYLFKLVTPERMASPVPWAIDDLLAIKHSNTTATPCCCICNAFSSSSMGDMEHFNWMQCASLSAAGVSIEDCSDRKHVLNLLISLLLTTENAKVVFFVVNTLPTSKNLQQIESLPSNVLNQLSNRCSAWIQHIPLDSMMSLVCIRGCARLFAILIKLIWNLNPNYTTPPIVNDLCSNTVDANVRIRHLIVLHALVNAFQESSEQFSVSGSRCLGFFKEKVLIRVFHFSLDCVLGSFNW
jgi:hypothetical protein